MLCCCVVYICVCVFVLVLLRPILAAAQAAIAFGNHTEN